MHHYVTGQRPQIMAWMISIRYSRRKEGQIERSMFSCQSSRDMGRLQQISKLDISEAVWMASGPWASAEQSTYPANLGIAPVTLERRAAFAGA